MTKLGAYFYLVGTATLIPSTVLFLAVYSAHYNTGVYLLLLAVVLVTVAATVNLVDAITNYRQHNRHYKKQRMHSYIPLQSSNGQYSDPPRCCVSLFNPLMMLQGGLFFIGGTVCYLPQISTVPLHYLDSVANMGTWVFRIGTCSYLAGSFAGLWTIAAATPPPSQTSATVWKRAVYNLNSSRRVVAGIVAFIVGALLYFAGGILSQLKLPGFAETWVAGSVFFFLGAALFMPPC